MQVTMTRKLLTGVSYRLPVVPSNDSKLRQCVRCVGYTKRRSEKYGRHLIVRQQRIVRGDIKVVIRHTFPRFWNQNPLDNEEPAQTENLLSRKAPPSTVKQINRTDEV